jgi:hypothetical protein
MHPLADAFIQGRAKLKKNTEKYFDDPKKPKKACYMGAMYYGLTGKPTDQNCSVLMANDWPQLHKMVTPPCSCDTTGYVSSILIHLNDFHDGREWSDKKITDWMESVL